MNKNIVVIGGGTGSFTVLSGLKKYPLNISAIITMMDSGGSTGRLRDQLGVLPPGDLRQSLVALSNSSNLLRDLFNYRYENGDLTGHTFGNIFLSTIEKISGSNEKALEEISKILNVKGKVIPVTYDKCHLIAEYEDGSKIIGETHIDESLTSRPKIINLSIKPTPNVNKDVIDAINKSDFIILGPGDLYTSIFPNLVVPGVIDCISKSKAEIIYISNLMTKKGQTDNYTHQDHIDEVNKYLKGNLLDFVIVNNKKPNKKVLEYYQNLGNVYFVYDDLKEETKFEIIREDIISQQVHSKNKSDKLVRSFIRHDSEKLAKTLYNIFTKS